MDIYEFGFVGLMTYGFINVLSIFKPGIDSKIKFAASLLVAFLLLWVPVDLGNLLFDKMKAAISIAVAMSGISALATKSGGR